MFKFEVEIDVVNDIELGAEMKGLYSLNTPPQFTSRPDKYESDMYELFYTSPDDSKSCVTNTLVIRGLFYLVCGNWRIDTASGPN